jgi:hypothetical protein
MSAPEKSIPYPGNRVRGRLSGLALACVLLAATTARGQSTARDPIGAEELFRQGLAALRADDWDTACAKFRKSMDLDPAVSTQSKLVKCSEHNGKLVTAWYEFENALKLNRDAPVSERRRAELDVAIRAALAELRPLVPKMSVKVQPNPPGLEVTRDGLPVVNSVLGELLPVDPGEHEVVVRAPGFEEARRAVTVERGRSLEVEVNLVPSIRQASPPAPPAQMAGPKAIAAPAESVGAPPAQSASLLAGPSTQSPPSQSHRWGQRETGYAVIGAGGVMLAVAGFFGIRALKYVHDMDDHKLENGTYDPGVNGPRDKALKAQTLGLVCAGIGAGLAGVGVSLWLTAPTHTANQASSRHEDSWGLDLRGTF